MALVISQLDDDKMPTEGHRHLRDLMTNNGCARKTTTEKTATHNIVRCTDTVSMACDVRDMLRSRLVTAAAMIRAQDVGHSPCILRDAASLDELRVWCFGSRVLCRLNKRKVAPTSKNDMLIHVTVLNVEYFGPPDTFDPFA